MQASFQSTVEKDLFHLLSIIFIFNSILIFYCVESSGRLFFLSKKTFPTRRIVFALAVSSEREAHLSKRRGNLVILYSNSEWAE